MTFGEQLRYWRKAANMNQRTLAEKAGIDFTYLSKIETGKMDPPSVETMERLALSLEQNPVMLYRAAEKYPATYLLRRSTIERDALRRLVQQIDALRYRDTSSEFEDVLLHARKVLGEP